MRQQNGFSALETAVVLAVITVLGLSCVVYVKAHQKTTSSNTAASSSAAPSKPEAYKRTTTTPKDWKLYTNAAYKFSIDYPGTVAPVTSDDNKTVPGTEGFNVFFPIPQTSYTGVTVYKTGISQVVTDLTRLQNDNPQPGRQNAISIKQYPMTYDGYPASRLTYIDKTGLNKPSTRTLLVAAHGNVYVLTLTSDVTTDFGKNQHIITDSFKILP